MIKQQHSIHSGSGTLRGGGVVKIYDNRLSLKDYKRKLDERVGILMILCLFTLATILLIFGLYYEVVEENMISYTKDIIEYIKKENAISTTIASTTTTTTTTTSTTTPTTTTTTIPINLSEFTEVDNEQKNLIVVTEPTINNMLTTSLEISLTTTPIETTTINSSLLTIEELIDYGNQFKSVHITIWTLMTINIIWLIILTPFIYLFKEKLLKFSMYNCTPKTLYRTLLILTLILMFGQFLFVLDPLLTTSYAFSDIVDRLFVNGYPQPENIRNLYEDKFACTFITNKLLEKYKLQDACIPKINDHLLPTYIVVVLIIVDLFPLFFAIFTYSWANGLKDYGVIRTARDRIELNYQRRTQPREQIISDILNHKYSYKINSGLNSPESITKNSHYAKNVY